MSRSYTEVILLPSFLERYRYLRLSERIGEETFGSFRQLNQAFYTSEEWKSARAKAIRRDNGCDLAMEGFEIHGRIYVHHIEPITPDDIRYRSPRLLDPDNLICVSFDTHQAITYGDENLLLLPPIERRPNDTCPWKRTL